MSIIYDALKKAEKAINQVSKVQVDTTDKHPKSNFKLYLLYVLVVCLGLFIGNIIFDFLANSKKSLAGHIKPLPIAKKPEGTSRQEPLKETPPKPSEAPSLGATPAISFEIKKKPQESFVLNGVFFSQDEGYALINNRIVKEGDVVGGATVMRINLNEVELKTLDSTIKLSTQVR